MNQTSIIVIILAIVVAIVVVNYLNNRRKHHSPENLKQKIDQIFAKANSDTMSKKQFLLLLKNAYSGTHKEATYLLGQAREAGFIMVEENQVRWVK
ncbi:MAG: hypothetical protein MSD82_13065 [Prevotella sp.]|nr:hypothetical protein [Prevotella sp.]